MLGLEPLAQVRRGAAVAVVLDHPREQLVRGLAGHQVESLLVAVGGQHQTRLQLQQGRDQHKELGGGLQIELAGALEVLHVGEHHVGQVDLEEVDLLVQHQRQEQVERALEDLEVEVERGYGHRGSLDARSDAHSGVDVGHHARRDRARPLSALPQRGLQRGLVGPELEIALPHGC